MQAPLLRDARLILSPPDIILTGQNVSRHFTVHRLLLMCISPYFQKLIEYSQGKYELQKLSIVLENGQQVTLECVCLGSVSVEIVSAIVEFAYTGQVTINPNQIDDLIITADRFNIYGLILTACNYLQSQISVNNCISMNIFAENYNCWQLCKSTFNYLLDNFEQITFNGGEFVELVGVDFLEKCLSTDLLYVNDEYNVWLALMRWIEHDPINRRPYFSRLAKHTRFGLIDKTKLDQIIMKNALVSQCPTTMSLIKEVLTLRHLLESGERLSSEVEMPASVQRALTPRYPRDIVIVFGGRSFDSESNVQEQLIEAYDPKAERWRPIDIQDPCGARDHHQVVVAGDNIYVLGGHHLTFKVSNSCRRFNIPTRQWSEISPMNEDRAFHACVLLDNYIYAIGGYNGIWRVDSVERYDIAQNQWQMVAPMNERRSGAGAAVLNGRIYVVGGVRDMIYLKSAECYVPEKNEWFTMEDDMTFRRCSAAAVVLENNILVIGGWNGLEGLRTVELWCRENNRWLLGTKLNQRRTGCAACVVKNIPNIEQYVCIDRDRVPQQRLLNAIYGNDEDENERASEQHNHPYESLSLEAMQLIGWEEESFE